MINIDELLLEAYNETPYPVGGHGKRNVQVLKDAIMAFDGDTMSDMYGDGPIIADFEKKIANVLGKPAAVFFPSGTMAQQIALRIWCDRKGLKRVAYHPLSHLEIHEKDGLKELHHIETVLLADKERTIELPDVLELKEDVSCLLLELPQREIGGQLPSYSDLEAISAYCREKGIRLHLDGARLFEILPYYGKTASEVCSLFDSVYVSFYKGIGGVAGAIVAGEQDFADESKIWKRRHGGDLISLYPYIISADKNFDERVGRMAHYYEAAVELAAMFNECESVVTKPAVPVSNMFHVHASMSYEKFGAALIASYRETGVGMTPFVRGIEDEACYFDISLGDRYEGVPKEKLASFFKALQTNLKEIADFDEFVARKL
ncbi:threonine aldolase family protein [Cohnella soli]|uniref:Threonine aldolase family protein n=1 Tax=Cohnella soli TaxID=425005 RepID=A0ABW0HZL1_9BACL